MTERSCHMIAVTDGTRELYDSIQIVEIDEPKTTQEQEAEKEALRLSKKKTDEKREQAKEPVATWKIGSDRKGPASKSKEEGGVVHERVESDGNHQHGGRNTRKS